MKKLKIPRSYCEYIKQMHDAGFTSIKFILGSKLFITALTFSSNNLIVIGVLLSNKVALISPPKFG
jgi:hypothetical protein